VHLSEKRFFQETPGRAILKKDSPSSKQPDLSKTDLCYPAPNALSAFMGRTASLFFKLNRLETTSRHRSQKGIESDINRNCQQNAKKEFPGNEPAEKNGRRVEKKKHKKCLSRTKGNGNSKKDSPVQSSRSLNWGNHFHEYESIPKGAFHETG
jgi:hypothetical protein